MNAEPLSTALPIRADVVRRLRQAEADVRALGADRLYLFGSVARDEAGKRSDIDLFIDPDPARAFGFSEFMDVLERLQEALGRPVSCTTREGLHPILRKGIESSAIRVF